MDRVFKMNLKTVFAMYIAIDLLGVGLGMGVPFFCILFGFPVGWYIARRATVAPENMKDVFKQIFTYAIITAAFTFIIMSIIWGGTLAMLFDPDADFQNFGIPLILYAPKISFIGWLVLMILISPFLQLLTTIFGSYVALLSWSKNDSSVV